MKRKMTPKQPFNATFALMWLCAQPSVSKHIRKLGNPLKLRKP